MTLTIPELIALVACVAIAGFLVHKYLSGSVVAKIEDTTIADVRRVAPALEASGMQALTAAEAWLTDTSSEKAAVARAQASIATKEALLRQHIQTLSAHLPTAAPNLPPAA